MKEQPKITAAGFRECTGHEPILDALERANCPDAGKVGHWQCGWCVTNNLPRFECGCVECTKFGK